MMARTIFGCLTRIFLSLILYTSVKAGGFHFGAGMGTSGGGGGGSTISLTCWAEADCSGAVSCTATSTTKTLTVPGGNSGKLKFNYSTVTTAQYSKNGGAFTNIGGSGSTVTFVNNDTLALKFGTMGSGGGEIDVDVLDFDSGTTLCTVAFVNTHS